MTPLKQRGRIRQTNISTIGLNNMTPLKERGKIRQKNIYI
jgi:hypothetical protein